MVVRVLIMFLYCLEAWRGACSLSEAWSRACSDPWAAWRKHDLLVQHGDRRVSFLASSIYVRCLAFCFVFLGGQPGSRRPTAQLPSPGTRRRRRRWLWTNQPRCGPSKTVRRGSEADGAGIPADERVVFESARLRVCESYLTFGVHYRLFVGSFF
jgi:hypothetical protein